MAFIFITAAILYSVFLLLIFKGIRINPRHKNNKNNIPFISIIVPIRNEEKHIKNCLIALANQTYPQNKYEIILVDDESNDNTLKVIKHLAASIQNLKIIKREPENKLLSPKKDAIAQGIKMSLGEIVFITDADCIVGNTWLEHMIIYFEDNVAAVTSWLQIPSNGSFFNRIESLDSLSFSIVGAAGIGLGLPIIANGANLAYRKSIFKKMDGFKDIDQYASGDDDLLLQKIFHYKNHKIVFSNNLESNVTTKHCTSLKEFFQQRLRWASKYNIYSPFRQVLLLFIYGFFLLLPLSLLCLIFQKYVSTALIFICIKFTGDYFLVRYVSRQLSRPFNFIDFIATEFFQMFYIPVISILGLLGRFTWKGRKYKRGQLQSDTVY